MLLPTKYEVRSKESISCGDALCLVGNLVIILYGFRWIVAILWQFVYLRISE
jgi:hypothetical protein